MTQKDQLKLLKAGYMLIRARDFDLVKKYTIVCKTNKQHEWHNFKPIPLEYTTKAERDRNLKTLLKNSDKVIEV